MSHFILIVSFALPKTLNIFSVQKLLFFMSHLIYQTACLMHLKKLCRISKQYVAFDFISSQHLWYTSLVFFTSYLHYVEWHLIWKTYIYTRPMNIFAEPNRQTTCNLELKTDLFLQLPSHFPMKYHHILQITYPAHVSPICTFTWLASCPSFAG